MRRLSAVALLAPLLLAACGDDDRTVLVNPQPPATVVSPPPSTTVVTPPPAAGTVVVPQSGTKVCPAGTIC